MPSLKGHKFYGKCNECFLHQDNIQSIWNDLHLLYQIIFTLDIFTTDQVTMKCYDIMYPFEYKGKDFLFFAPHSN